MKNKVNSTNLIEILGKVVLNVSHLVTLINESNEQGQVLKADSSLTTKSKNELFKAIKDTPLAYMTKYVVIINPDLIRSECMPAGQRQGITKEFYTLKGASNQVLIDIGMRGVLQKHRQKDVLAENRRKAYANINMTLYKENSADLPDPEAWAKYMLDVSSTYNVEGIIDVYDTDIDDDEDHISG